MFFPINTLLAIIYSSWPVPRLIVLGPMELLDNDYRTIFFMFKNSNISWKSWHCTLREDIQRTKLIIYGNDAYSFITRNLEFSKITAPIKDTQSSNFKYRFF